MKCELSWVPMPKLTSLHPQDVLVACKIFSLGLGRQEWTFAGLGREVGISTGEAHNSLERCRGSGLLGAGGTVVRRALRDLLVVGAPQIFYASRGGISRGLPTSVWAPPLGGMFELGAERLPAVWPLPGEAEGAARGEAVDPIYPSAPVAARDPVVYELLALLDVIRIGGTSERKRAAGLVERRLFDRDGNPERVSKPSREATLLTKSAGSAREK